MSAVAVITGPSGGETGRAETQQFARGLYEKHPDLVRRMATIGRHQGDLFRGAA